jgi:hypothetical protein
MPVCLLWVKHRGSSTASRSGRPRFGSSFWPGKKLIFLNQITAILNISYFKLELELKNNEIKSSNWSLKFAEKDKTEIAHPDSNKAKQY